jgi:hypothetical protein
LGRLPFQGLQLASVLQGDGGDGCHTVEELKMVLVEPGRRVAGRQINHPKAWPRTIRVPQPFVERFSSRLLLSDRRKDAPGEGPQVEHGEQIFPHRINLLLVLKVPKLSVDQGDARPAPSAAGLRAVTTSENTSSAWRSGGMSRRRKSRNSGAKSG